MQLVYYFQVVSRLTQKVGKIVSQMEHLIFPLLFSRVKELDVKIGKGVRCPDAFAMYVYYSNNTTVSAIVCNF